MKRNVFELYGMLGFSMKKKHAMKYGYGGLLFNKDNKRETTNKSFASHCSTN